MLVAILAAIALPLTLLGRKRLQQPVQPSIAADSLPPALDQEVANPSEPSLSTQDLAAIQATIDQQLAAFQAEDAETAFSFASPDIQAQFQTPDQFMAMVKAQYIPVYRPQSITFEAIKVVHGSPVQAVTLLGPTGQWVTAYYQMEQQTDTTWRIAGCVLVPLAGETI